MKRLFGVITLMLFACILFAQPPISEQQAKAELDKRGIDEDVMRQKLLERGIDIDQIDQNDPGRLLEVQAAIEEIMAELESEKTGVVAPTPTLDVEPVKEQIVVDSAEAVIQEIKSTDIEEDIAETLIDEFQETLPPSTVFGQHVFRDKSIKLYRQSEDIKPPNSYVLGVGDVIAVSIWGTSQEGGVYEINKSGFISPSRMPRIYLKGLSLEKARELIQRRFSNYYRFRPEEFELTINYSRTITINIVGEVANYGSYTIPAINTAFNALVAGGGPSDIGSVRNIQLIRAGQQPKRIDIYEYLLNPSVQNEYYLQENDYIHVPIAERTVTIAGAVNRRYTFELTKGEDFKKLLEFAGGFTFNAYKSNIQIRRFINDEEVIIDLDYTQLENSEKDFQLLNGDFITVKNISKPYKNFIEVSGAVEFEGRFELTSRMRIGDLIEKATLTESARRDVAFIQRSNLNGTVRFEKIDLTTILSDPNSPKNLLLEPKDKLLVYNQPAFIDNATFSVSGAVRNPRKLPFSVGKEVKIDDAVLLAGGLLPDATSFGYIRRINPKNKKLRETIRVDIQQALENPSSLENITLQPFDELKIYSIQTYTDDATFSISGTVRTPSEYPYARNTSIKDMIEMAGGLTPDATTFGYIRRVDPTNSKKNSILRVDIKKAYEQPESADNLILEPFDNLSIYSKLTYTDDDLVINVSGAVRNPGSFKYAENFTVKDVLTLAGGLRMEAAKSRIEIFRVIFKDNEPTETIVAVLEVNDSLDIISKGGNLQLAPYDLVVVRRIPDFEFLNVVTINGEVKYPGAYPLMDDNERLLSIIERSGGITNKAFPEGATLYRSDENVGYIVIELDKVLNKTKTRNNFILKAGDLIEIPKQKDLVTVEGATRANELYPEKVLQGGKINVAYRKGKNAKWYVNHYAAGVGESGQRKRISVLHPNGEVEKTKSFLFFKDYPSVRKGSIVTVGAKPPKKPKEKKNGETREKVNWGESLANGLAQATAVLSLILLVQQVNK